MMARFRGIKSSDDLTDPAESHDCTSMLCFDKKDKDTVDEKPLLRRLM